MVLVEATVHVRHVRNWYLFGRSVGLLKGRMEYPRGVILRNPALDIFLFSVLYTSLFLVTGSLFVLGGAVGCCALSIPLPLGDPP